MEDKQVRSDEARRNLRDLMDEVQHHDVHVTILRYDKPAAVLVSVEWYEQARALIAAVRHGIHPVAPSQELDPWRMEPGDCQRTLADIWEVLAPPAPEAATEEPPR